jgi:long-chain acyl-CoA synthetase
MNVYRVLMHNRDEAKVAIQSKTEQVTYGELHERIKAVSTLLTQYEVQVGDRVGILAHNSSFWVACYLGILRHGAIAVPIPHDQHKKTIHQFLEITGCQICFVDDDHHKKFASLPVQHIITPERVQQTNSQDTPIFEPSGHDLAALMFTSGSTGVPNAVKVSHKNILTNTRSIVDYLQLDEDDRMMVVLPFYYCFGTSLLHTHLFTGGSLIINNQFMFVENVLDDMETYECTGFAGVPSVYLRLVKRSGFMSRNFKHLRLFQQAGGRLSHDIIKQVVEAFPEKKFYVMYGQTEATARLTYLPPEQVLKKVNSIGQAIPYVNIEILNEDYEPIQPGEQGEIVCSGDSITRGYWQGNANNRFVDGKLHTGDIATIDEDGYMYIVGRQSDFLKPGGNRFSKHTIIDALLLHPDIIEAEVMGIFEAGVGEVVHAFIGVGDTQLSENDVKRHCLAHLPRFAIPQEIKITKELPKNSAGKIQRQLLLNYMD